MLPLMALLLGLTTGATSVFSASPMEQHSHVPTDGPVSYACAGGLLTRNGVTVVDGVTGCSFAYSLGTESRFAVVSLSLTLERGDESVTLMRQVQVENLS